MRINMKISELIDNLQGLETAYGDVEVKFFNGVPDFIDGGLIYNIENFIPATSFTVDGRKVYVSENLHDQQPEVIIITIEKNIRYKMGYPLEETLYIDKQFENLFRNKENNNE